MDTDLEKHGPGIGGSTQGLVIPPYDGVVIFLHWASAALILALWLIGQLNGYLPRGPVRLGIWSTHVVLGLILTVAVAVRLFWRARQTHVPVAEGWMEHAARIVHHLLYVLLAAVIALGIWQAFVRGIDMYGVFQLPTLPGSRELAGQINGWHGLLANALMITAVLHAAAAFYHHFVLRDLVLRRMIPARRAHRTT